MIFRQVWLAASILLLLVGIGLREPVLASVGALVLLSGGVSRAWSRLALERVAFERVPAERRAFVGEEIEVRFSVVNRKTLPLPWVQVLDLVPDALPAVDVHTSPSAVQGSLLVTRDTSLSWYERVRWSHRFQCSRRGFYGFGPARLRSGDIFGLFPVEREIGGRSWIAVLPRVVELPALGLPSERPFGELRSSARLFEDPARVAGVRDYRAGDPLKRIDWKATARRQSLQSRVLDPSSSLSLLVALSVDTLEHTWEGYDPVVLERAVVVAGSVAAWADGQRQQTGLLANCSYPGADRPISIPPGGDPEQLTRILEALAMVAPYTIAPLEGILTDITRNLGAGATVAVVAGFLTEGLAVALSRLARGGTAVALLWVGDAPPPIYPARVRVHELGAAMRTLERTWNESGRTPRPGEQTQAASWARPSPPPSARPSPTRGEGLHG